MKKITLPFILIILIAVFISFITTKDDTIKETVTSKPRNGTAIIMTGAAARIPQEAALLEELDKRGLLKDLVFISGSKFRCT